MLNKYGKIDKNKGNPDSQPHVRNERSAGVKVETTPKCWLARPSQLWTQQPEFSC